MFELQITPHHPAWFNLERRKIKNWYPTDPRVSRKSICCRYWTSRVKHIVFVIYFPLLSLLYQTNLIALSACQSKPFPWIRFELKKNHPFPLLETVIFSTCVCLSIFLILKISNYFFPECLRLHPVRTSKRMFSFQPFPSISWCIFLDWTYVSNNIVRFWELSITANLSTRDVEIINWEK